MRASRLSFRNLIGNTPCVKLVNVSKIFGCDVYGKIESLNPTGSHKDRENLEALQDAVNRGYTEIGCASTGNAAISLAALSYMSGVRCHIYVPRTLWREKLALIKAFHPVLHLVRGDYATAVSKSLEEMQKLGIYAANPGVCDPKIIGDSHVGREISQVLKPDLVICPANNGTHIIGVWEGLKRNGCRPAVVAATAKKTGIADSIGGFHRSEGKKLDQMLRESNASIVNVTDSEIRTAWHLLTRDGVIAEPAGAAGVAALRHLNLPANAVVCCTITGTGLKFPTILRRMAAGHRASISRPHGGRFRAERA